MRYLPILLLLTACPGGFGGPIDIYGKATRWEYLGEPAPRCADEVHLAAMALSPCTSGVPRHGWVAWIEGPFVCSPNPGLVYACTALNMPWVQVWSMVTPNAYDGPLAHELGHYVWNHCAPGKPVEWWEDADGKQVPLGSPTAVNYHEDPGFRAWVALVNKTAKDACK
jgi:hypothetical protein